jgi:glutaredoxin-related protein
MSSATHNPLLNENTTNYSMSQQQQQEQQGQEQQQGQQHDDYTDIDGTTAKGSVLAQFCKKGKDDFVAYLAEYGFRVNDFKYKAEMLEKRKKITSSINTNDVVVIAKVGCGFCQKAKDALAGQQERQPFSLDVIIGTDPISRAVTSDLLRLSDLTFPQVVIRGLYVGGSDDLRRLIEAGEFDQVLAAPPLNCAPDAKVHWYPPMETLANHPDLFLMPTAKGSVKPSWVCFQWYMYSNLVRYISMCHAVLLLVCLILAAVENPSVANKRTAYAIVVILVVDLCILVLHGPAPFSPSGILGTYFGWRYRGNATSSVPYKVVFAAYLFSMIPLLAQGNGDSKGTSSVAAIATYTSLVINSSLLVVFRF